MGNIGFILLALWIAVSNLGLGFALAVALGHGPQRWPRLRLPALKFPTLKLPSLRRSPQAEEKDTTEHESASAADAPVESEPETTVEDGMSLETALAEFEKEVAIVRDEEEVAQAELAATA